VGTGALLFAVLAPVAARPAFATATGKLPKALTGAYQLYCPDPVETPIVLHVRATATIVPIGLAAGDHFVVGDFQTEITFPQGVASALAQMSPITGSVKGRVNLIGAAPRTSAVAETFVANFPSSAPAAGFELRVPARPARLGSFTATSAGIAVEEASRFVLTLEVGQGSQAQTRVLSCTAFANATNDFDPAQPWVGTKEPPFSDAIVPVIALEG
jgi:hypothetical protein